MVQNAFENNEIHKATEAHLMGLVAFGKEERQFRPVFCVGSCQKGSPEHQEEIIVNFLDFYYEEKADEWVGEIWYVASDGDSKRRQAMNRCLREKVLDENTPFFSHISELPGLDLRVGRESIVPFFDFKHCIKRIRTRLVSVKIPLVIGTCAFTAASLKAHMIEAGVKADKIAAIMYPADKMNVPSALRLLRTIIDLPAKKSVNDFEKAKFAAYNQALKILKSVLRCVISILDVELDLSTQLVKVSRLGFTMSWLFKVAGSNFLPSQLYHDLQTDVVAFYHFAARGVQLCSNGDSFDLALHQPGTDQQEDTHGLTRTLSHSRNFDMAELGYNLSKVQQIQLVYDKYPDLQRKDQRRGVQSLSKTDKVRIYQCTGDIDCASLHGELSLKHLWAEGRRLAVECLTKHGFFDRSEVEKYFAALNDTNTLLAPGGICVGVRSLGDELSDEEETEVEVETANEVTDTD